MLTESNINTLQDRRNVLSSRQKNYTRTFQLYFLYNLQCLVNSNKNCLLQIDQQYKTLNKNDKFWIQTHLKEIYQNSAQKLEKEMLQKNIKNKQQINAYKNQFQKKKKKVIKSKALRIDQQQYCSKIPKYFFTFISDPIDKRIFLHSTKLQTSFNLLQSSRKKQSFSSRRYRNNDQFQLQSNGLLNTKYMQKLQRIKLQSTYTQLFFQEHTNTIQNQEDQPIQIKRIVSRIKAISAARNNFRVKNLLTANNNRDKIKLSQQKKWNNFLVNYLKGQGYKPKSRQRQKLILNFNA